MVHNARSLYDAERKSPVVKVVKKSRIREDDRRYISEFASAAWKAWKSPLVPKVSSEYAVICKGNFLGDPSTLACAHKTIFERARKTR